MLPGLASMWPESRMLTLTQEPATLRGAAGLASVLLWEGVPSGFLLESNFTGRPCSKKMGNTKISKQFYPAPIVQDEMCP